MDEKEAEARPVMGTIFLVIFEFMYLLFLNSCTYYFLIHVLNIFDLKIVFMFLFIIILRHSFCYIHFMTYLYSYITKKD